MKRLLTAAVFLPGFLALVLWAPAWSFALLAAVTTTMAILEFARLARRSGFRVHRWVAAVAAVVACFLFLDPVRSAQTILWVGLIGCVLALMAGMGRESSQRALPSAAATMLAIFYPGILLAHMVGIRVLEGDQGRRLLLFLLAIIWVADTAAYYVGSALGRHKLAPRISPGKTVEGAVAAVLAGAGAAWAFQAWFLPQIGSSVSLGMGAALALVGILGDLIESVLKRGAGVKDTAAVLPGHGGILDRVDSLLLAGPLFYHLYPWIVG